MGNFPIFDHQRVSVTLHVVRDDVFLLVHGVRHVRECGLVASQGVIGVLRATFHARTFLTKAKDAASREFNVHTCANNTLLGTCVLRSELQESHAVCLNRFFSCRLLLTGIMARSHLLTTPGGLT